MLESIPASSPQVNSRKKQMKSSLSACRSKEERTSCSLKLNFNN